MAADPLTILLVDGDRKRRAARARALAGAGYRVLQAGDARRALVRLLRERPQLAVARLALKPFDGVELLERARAHPLTSHIPFVLLRARRDAEREIPPLTRNDRILDEPVGTAQLLDQAEERIFARVRAHGKPRPRLDLLRLEVHDLKAPLGNIIHLSELMLAEAVEPEQRAEFLASIAANAQNMLKLVMNVLNLAALDSGRLALRLEPVSLHELTQSAMQQIAWLIRRRGTRVINRVPTDLPAPRADAELLGRVLVNLLDNALQHGAQENEVIATAEVEGDGVRIDVLDRGPGVPERFRERIFDEFFRIDAGSGLPQSTGLGLTFCRLVAEAHGGRIWVSDREGGGSRFSLHIPLGRPAEGRGAAETPARSSSGRRKPAGVTAQK